MSGLFDALRDLLAGGESARTGSGASGRDAPGSEREIFEYRCRDCDTEFESNDRHVTTASCPDCGSEDVRVGEDPY